MLNQAVGTLFGRAPVGAFITVKATIFGEKSVPQLSRGPLISRGCRDPRNDVLRN